MIEIPDTIYEDIKENFPLDANVDYVLKCAISEGIPLPKNHGRLIDADKMKSKMLYSHDIGAEIETNGTEATINYIFDDAPTIIEADKAESEEV